ncbi:hypothetical protein KC19_8G047800, partial [Ceratodon purpureus]
LTSKTPRQSQLRWSTAQQPARRSQLLHKGHFCSIRLYLSDSLIVAPDRTLPLTASSKPSSRECHVQRQASPITEQALRTISLISQDLQLRPETEHIHTLTEFLVSVTAKYER